MNPQPFTLFFSILGLVAIGLILLDIIANVTKAKSLLKFTAPIRLELATAIALTSMGGSLFFSEVLGFEPCFLCWVQRGFMYPAAVLLLAEALTVNLANKPTGRATGIEKLKNVHLAAWAGIALALPGLAVAAFHRYEQAAGSKLDICDAAVPCESKYFNEFGFITIPTLAAIGFAGIAYFGITFIRAEAAQRSASVTIGSKE